jgi:hypothetical protein
VITAILPSNRPMSLPFKLSIEFDDWDIPATGGTTQADCSVHNAAAVACGPLPATNGGLPVGSALFWIR